jgi:hypothetical protein
MRKIGLVAAAALACALLGAQAASAAGTVCVAANDEVRVDMGTATCEAEGTGSVAIATGEDSTAWALAGDWNRAIAGGDGSEATAGFGDNNTATATTEGCEAIAEGGGQTDTC